MMSIVILGKRDLRFMPILTDYYINEKIVTSGMWHG